MQSLINKFRIQSGPYKKLSLHFDSAKAIDSIGIFLGVIST